MVRIGLVGIGFMGRIHFLGARKLQGAAVTAVCSRDGAKLAGDWTNTRGNFGPPPGQVDLGECKRYERFEQMLADPDIDLVDVCTPTHLHPEMAIAALEAGKHVLVEKAIALTTADADAMVEAARRAGRLLMVAHVLPFFPEFRYLDDAVRGGAYGKLLGGHFTRVISRPDWSSDIGDVTKTGGPAVDLHIHDTHFVGLLAGVPARVCSTGIVAPDGSVEYLTTHYLYEVGPYPHLLQRCGRDIGPAFHPRLRGVSREGHFGAQFLRSPADGLLGGRHRLGARSGRVGRSCRFVHNRTTDGGRGRAFG